MTRKYQKEKDKILNTILQHFDPEKHDLEDFIQNLPQEYYDRLIETNYQFHENREKNDAEILYSQDDIKAHAILMKRLTKKCEMGNSANPADPEKKLRQQAHILNLAFIRLMHAADTFDSLYQQMNADPATYAAAFKAQDQYRRTVKTLHELKMSQKRTEKVKKSRGKRPYKSDQHIENK